VNAIAICLRRTGQGLEVLLIRTQDGRRWTFPGGGVEAGEAPDQAVGVPAVAV